MTPIEFTHTTYQKPVFVYPDQIIAITYLPTMKSIVLVGPGSTAIPVVGTIEEVEKKVTNAKNDALKQMIVPGTYKEIKSEVTKAKAAASKSAATETKEAHSGISRRKRSKL